jgi:hypothetical protein
LCSRGRQSTVLYRYYTGYTPPSYKVSQTILATQVSVLNMSKELLPLVQQADLDTLQNEEEEKEQTPMKDIDAEIEYPRCYDMMTLSSDFDRLGYLYQECNLSLFLN